MSLDRRDTPGRRLLGGAWAFWHAARLLHEYDPDALAWATIFVNLGLAIELAVEGFLREKGCSEREQLDLRHDLMMAFSRAREHGFNPSHPAQEDVIAELNPHYKDMSLRYLTGTSVELPEVRNSLAIVRALVFDLHTQAKLPIL
jgi:hypothetical protein